MKGVMKLLKQKKSVSLKKKLHFFMVIIMAPFILLVIVLIVMLANFSKEYDSIVANVTAASEFNFDFRKTVDYKMYQIVIGTKDFEEQKPYDDIKAAKRVVNKLKDNASTKESARIIARQDRSLDTLTKRIADIEVSYKNPANYDKNMERLDSNIRILTELIQEKMSDYIYYETLHLDTLRIKMAEDTRRTIYVAVGVFGALVVIVWWLTFVITESIARPIRALSENTRLVGKGNFTIRAPKDENDEIQLLSQNFNQMVERIGDLVEDVKLEQLQLRDTELKLLQSQINPHFLYNTLDTIVWLAEDKQYEEVITMVNALSDFFRTSLSKGKSFITIGEEKSHVESYLKIQQFRYQDILDYEINIPLELESYQVLKLTLQPLVENALYHGIKTKRGKGKITITAKQKGADIILIVSDNGKGMSANKLDLVRKEISRRGAEEPFNGFGLYNVNERICLNYGKGYGLVMESEEGVGTKSIITIPVRT